MAFLTPRLIQNIYNQLSYTKQVSEVSGFIQIRNYAARKGTRERREKKKKAAKVVEVKKKEFVPHNLRKLEKELQNRRSKKCDDSALPEAKDNVYVSKLYKWKIYSVVEAVEGFKETHHPEMYNRPKAKLHAKIELNMQGEKKNRFIENFTRTAFVPHAFDHGEERSILAFTKDPAQQQEAIEAGAQLAGGVELVSQIQNGSLSVLDFKYVVAHPSILPELAVLRGLMKRKFPSPTNGSLHPDVVEATQRFKNGITYTARKDDYEKDFGLIDAIIGTLDMEASHLEENFASLVKDVYLMKPKHSKGFIRRCLFMSPPSIEKMKVDHLRYLDIVEEEELDDDDEDEENVVLQ